MSGENDLNSSLLQSAVRKREYKHLLELGGQAAENLDNKSIADNLTTLKDLLTRSNELAGQGSLSDRIGQSAEVVLDAQIESVLDEHNICDWSKLDGITAGFAKSFSATSSTFGIFDFDDVAGASQAAQKERFVRRKAANPTAEKRPTTVTEAGVNTETGSSKVEIVFNTIKEIYRKNGSKPIPYFQLVIDPTNMMYTFDNTFQVSFLFRDGCIAFVKDHEGGPAIKPLEDTLKPPKPSEMTSFTSTLSLGLIQKYIKKYNIREAMLKINRD
ncbi:EP300-interacting inhibitor of differentiation 3-like isoform X2 [Sitodiplosis mosellana]|uniref:EP300-interacting inhibitor of differentiation 3-like isoform X2 n=1 Tax=Sitodiplosis mosellana TaxID=263140 RepID=UPI002443B230|nr:EP300-interacting inhibitor of differentiation 3-like isoform X2 [Sitodiplosis mosellana]